ncbi:MAG: SPFH domain-containing protein [Candidatus Babeliales bacterium]
MLFIPLFVILTILFIHKSVYIVKQAEVISLERLGKFHRLLHSGIHFTLPFIDKPRPVYWTSVFIDRHGRYIRSIVLHDRIDLRESVYDFPKQNVITKDNVTIEINALLYYWIMDPYEAIYKVSNLPEAIEKLTQTTLRNVIGSLDLDETLVSRDQINEKLQIILDKETDPWGVKVSRVELQEVTPPEDVRIAMEKQMRAERDKRAVILSSEGKQRAAILEAEGEKKSLILEAEGIKESRILKAEGDAKARVVSAQAEAEAIEVIKQALGSAIDPTPYLIAINYIKALPEITKPEDKMILMPYEASALLGSLGALKELFNKPQSTKTT